MERIRANYPNAYKMWSPEEENLLRNAYCEKKSINEISRLLQRQPGGIRSRIRKLGLAAKRYKKPLMDVITESQVDGVLNLSLQFFPEDEINISIRLAWKPVLQDGAAPYLFPQSTTRFMNDNYHCPAIYRWKMIDPQTNCLLALYIGSTKALCPDRLIGYLQPDTSRTNQRLHMEFQRFLQQGAYVVLEILEVKDKQGTNPFALRLDRDGPRLFMENIIVHYYRCKGPHLLNL